MVECSPVKRRVARSNRARGAMKKMASLLLEQYKKMSGGKKVKIAMQWSKLVRDINKEGMIQTNVANTRTAS